MNRNGNERVVREIEYTGKRVLLIAPHPDDEVFGCAGILHKLRSNTGNNIRVLYITDGAKGAPENERSEALHNIRKQEATAVAERLGIDSWLFCDLPDGELDKMPAALYALIGSELASYNPDIVIFPYEHDLHSDHHMSANAVLYHKDYYSHVIFLEYVIWGEMPEANYYIALDQNEVELKLELAKLYPSQLELYDYLSLITSNLKKCGVEIKRSYAEAYLLKA